MEYKNQKNDNFDFFSLLIMFIDSVDHNDNTILITQDIIGSMTIETVILGTYYIAEKRIACRYDPELEFSLTHTGLNDHVVGLKGLSENLEAFILFAAIIHKIGTNIHTEQSYFWFTPELANKIKSVLVEYNLVDHSIYAPFVDKNFVDEWSRRTIKNGAMPIVDAVLAFIRVEHLFNLIVTGTGNITLPENNLTFGDFDGLEINSKCNDPNVIAVIVAEMLPWYNWEGTAIVLNGKKIDKFDTCRLSQLLLEHRLDNTEFGAALRRLTGCTSLVLEDVEARLSYNPTKRAY